MTVEPKERDKPKSGSSGAIGIERVVPVEEIGRLFREKPYLIEPDARGSRGKGAPNKRTTAREIAGQRRQARHSSHTFRRAASQPAQDPGSGPACV